MNIFLYDHTFEGLLTSVFEAYSRRTFPDALLLEGEPLPLFYDGLFTVVTAMRRRLVVSGGDCRRSCRLRHLLVWPSAGWPRSRKLPCSFSAISARQ